MYDWGPNHSHHPSMMSEVMSDLESRLECPICSEIPDKIKIFACKNSHSICERCHGKITKCPECQGSYDDPPRRSRDMENIIAATITEHECRNRELGCTFKAKQRLMREHGKICGFELQPCPKRCQKLFQVYRVEVKLGAQKANVLRFLYF